MIPDDDKDTVISSDDGTNKDFYITFGFGHHMGPEKERLSRCYTIIKAPSIEKARLMIYKKRGLKYASTYDTADAAGVDEHGLCFVEFDKVKRQEGENL